MIYPLVRYFRYNRYERLDRLDRNLSCKRIKLKAERPKPLEGGDKPRPYPADEFSSVGLGFIPTCFRT